MSIKVIGQVSLARPQGFDAQLFQFLDNKPLGSVQVSLARPQGFDAQLFQFLDNKPLGSV